MSKKVFFLALLLIAGNYVCNAAKIDGKWKTSMNGQMDLTFTFKVEGEKLTGSVTSDMGNLPIINGKIKNSDFTFDVDMEGSLIGHICKIDGEVIKMKVKMPEGMGGGEDPGEMILKRVEEK
jgi:hypothetical protein